MLLDLTNEEYSEILDALDDRGIYLSSTGALDDYGEPESLADAIRRNEETYHKVCAAW